MMSGEIFYEARRDILRQLNGGAAPFGEAPRIWSHLRMAPNVFRTFWTVASAVTAVVVCVAIKHCVSIGIEALRLRRAQNQTFLPSQSTLYLKLFLFAPFMALLTWASLFSLRFSLMFELLIHLYEVGCLLWFWHLMVDLLGGAENAHERLAAVASERIETFTSHHTRRRAAARITHICWIPWVFAERQWERRDMVASYLLVAQYLIFAVLAVLSMALSRGLFKAFSYVSTASIIVCMYGLVILFKASRQELKQYRLGQKFILLKTLVFCYKLLELFLQIPSLVPHVDETYSKDVMRSAWRAFLANCLTLPITLFGVRAFRVEELRALPVVPKSPLRWQPRGLREADLCGGIDTTDNTLPDESYIFREEEQMMLDSVVEAGQGGSDTAGSTSDTAGSTSDTAGTKVSGDLRTTSGRVTTTNSYRSRGTPTSTKRGAAESDTTTPRGDPKSPSSCC